MKSLKKLLTSLFVILSIYSYSQAVVTTTVTWTTGWCNICGPMTGNYACAQGSGSPMWGAGIRTFVDPVPAGNVVTGVCVTVNKVDCGLTNLCVTMNAVPIQCIPTPPGTNCSCGACWPQTFCNSFPCPTGIPNYVYGGVNQIQLINTGNLCVNNAVITLTYQMCCPTPTIIPSATPSVICQGQSSTLSATGAGVGGTYSWTAPGATIALTQSAVVTPTATTIYTVTGTTTYPCSGSKTIQIIVNPNPTVTASNNGPVCQGATVNLTTPAVPGGTLVNYIWNGPGSFTSIIQNPIIANAQPSNSGIYTITAINNFTNGGSCSGSGTTTVGIVPVNQTTVTPSFTLCQGETLNLTAVNGVPPISYLWNGPTAFTSSLQNPSITNIIPIKSGNYIMMATFATPGITFVCTSTAVTNVSVVATSPVTVSLPNNICQYGTANLTASTNPSALKYDWSGPNNFLATTSSTFIPSIMPNQSGIYNVVATWAIGTKSCTIGSFNQISVVPVNPIVINIPISVCYPANINLSASSAGAISYSWTGPNTFTSISASPLLSVPLPIASGVYSVLTAYTNGALMCYNSNTTQVTINPILPFGLTPYNQVCYDTPYMVAGPAGATTYTWLGAGGFTSHNQNLYISAIQAGQSGEYTLTINLGPCTTSAVTFVDVLSPISFTQTPGNKTICYGDSVKLTMGSTGGSRNYAYVWDPQIYLASPTGSTQYAHPVNTTIYNVYGYDISCPNHTINTSFTVNVNRSPQPDLKLTQFEGCQPFCFVYDSRTDATMIMYDFGNGNIMQADSFNYCLSDPGTYNLKIQTRGKNGCTGIYSQNPIVVWPTPHSDVNWLPENPTTLNNRVTFEPTNQYGPVDKYGWQFQGTNVGNAIDTSAIKNPLRVYDNVGKYPVMLISTSDKGCIDTVFKILEIRDEFSVYIPNTFTPNGDGLNDIFNVKGIGLKTEGFSMEIYDRWGVLVYSTKDMVKGWDGTCKGLFAENGVYVYKVKAMGANGEGKKEYVGHVSLLK